MLVAPRRGRNPRRRRHRNRGIGNHRSLAPIAATRLSRSAPYSELLYFGVFSILSHLAVLVAFVLGRQENSERASTVLATGAFIAAGAALLIWVLFAWLAYGDFNGELLGKTLAALILVLIASARCCTWACFCANSLLSSFVT